MKRRRSAHCRSVSLYCRHCSSTGSGTTSGCGSAGGGMVGKGRGAEPRRGRGLTGPGRVRRDQAPRVDQAAARYWPPESAGPTPPHLPRHLPTPAPSPGGPAPQVPSWCRFRSRFRSPHWSAAERRGPAGAASRGRASRSRETL